MYSMAAEKNPWGTFTEEWITNVSAVEAWAEKKAKIEELVNVRTLIILGV